MPTARIKIDGLLLHAHHGVMEQERTCGNEFEVTVELDVEYCGSDSLDATVNYAEVIDLIRREMSIPSLLIEHVASRIGASIRREFPAVLGGSVTVAKLLPPVTARMRSVSVCLPL